MTDDELKTWAALAEKVTPWSEGWRPIPGYPSYEASDFGNIRSYVKRGNHNDRLSSFPRLLSQSEHPETRRRSVSVPCQATGKYSRKNVQSLVMEAFVGPRPEGKEIAHNNGDPTDNRLTNLRYATHLENEADKLRHGTRSIGERNGAARLQGWQVAEIRYLARKSVPQGRIAALFGIPVALVSEVVCVDNWKGVERLVDDIPALIAEVRRLKALVNAALPHCSTRDCCKLATHSDPDLHGDYACDEHARRPMGTVHYRHEVLALHVEKP